MSLIQKMQSAKNYLLVFGAVAIIGLSSCEKDDTTTTPTGTTIGGAFVTTSGSYWVYDKKKTDINGVVVPSSKITMDSTITGMSYDLDGKSNAVDFTTYSTDSTTGVWRMDSRKETYAKEGNIVYFSTTGIIGDIAPGGIPLDFGDISNIEKWVMSMQDKPTWDMLTFPINIPNLKVPGVDFGIDLKVSGDIKFTGAKLTNENITYENKTYSAMKFEMFTNVKAFVKTPVFTSDVEVVTISYPIKSHIWIVEGIGIVKRETLKSTTNLAINPLFASLLDGMGFKSGDTQNGGEISTLIRHKIK
jgi:hypothetical protein